jgi:hypothetical protein
VIVTGDINSDPTGATGAKPDAYRKFISAGLTDTWLSLRPLRPVIVSAGLLTTGAQLRSLAAGVALLTLSAGALNRALGVPAQRWAA